MHSGLMVYSSILLPIDAATKATCYSCKVEDACLQMAAFFCALFDRHYGGIARRHVMAYRKTDLHPNSSNHSGTTPHCHGDAGYRHQP